MHKLPTITIAKIKATAYDMVRGLAIAFGLFTRIPLPKIQWTKGSLRYMLCSFPMAGIAVALTVYALGSALSYLGLTSTLTAALCTAAPYILTGAIHADGYCDTMDAIASLKDKEAALKIMEDSHIGAMGVIAWSLHLLVCYALYYEIDFALAWHNVWAALMALELTSRAIAAAILVLSKPCKNSGLCYVFSKYASTKAVVLFSLLYLVASIIIGTIGLLWLRVSIMLVVQIGVGIGFYRYTKNRFGGVTGDLLGYAIELLRVAGLLVLVIGARL